MPIVIDFLSNVRDLLRGTKDVTGALDDVADSLDDVVRDGDKAERELERNFREIADASKDTSRDIDRNMRDGFDGAKKGADDFKDEASSTAKEAAASFDGSAESISGAFQEIAANAFSGFGPAGAVAGLAAAAGIGLASAGFAAADEARQKSQERIADWADAYLEAGGKVLTAGVMAARAQEIITDPEKFKEAETNAKNWGVSIETAIAAMTGNTGAIRDVQLAVDDLGDAYEQAREKAPAIDEYGQVNGLLLEQEQAYRTAKDSLGALTGEMTAGQQRAAIMNRYYEDLINTTSGVTKEVDELGNELYSLPDGTQVMVDAETRQASQNVSNFKGDLDGVPEKVTSTVTMRVDDTAVRNYVPPRKQAYVDYKARQTAWN